MSLMVASFVTSYYQQMTRNTRSYNYYVFELVQLSITYIKL